MHTPLDLEDVILFLDELRLDHARRHCLVQGLELVREAAKAGLIGDLSQLGNLPVQMNEARMLGLVSWELPTDDPLGYDLINGRDFRLTNVGLRHARELKGFPRFLLVAKRLDDALRERQWVSVIEDLDTAEREFRAHHWADSISHSYPAVESGLKFRISEAGDSSGDASALRKLVSQASTRGLIPANYQALFGFLDSVRSPRSHGRGPRPAIVEVGPAEALLMLNVARSLLTYLLQEHS